VLLTQPSGRQNHAVLTNPGTWVRMCCVELTFESVGGAISDTQTGSIWDAFGRALSGEYEGRQLQQVLAAPHAWFAWSAFLPVTAVFASSE